MTSAAMIWLVLSLLIMSIVSMVQTFRTLLLNVKGLDFLNNVKDIIVKNDDADALDALENVDTPTMLVYVSSLRTMFYLIYLALFLNTTLLMFIGAPVIHGTSLWDITIWMAAGINAAVIISFRGVSITKQDINAICESYAVLIQSYKFVEECEDNDDDRTD